METRNIRAGNLISLEIKQNRGEKSNGGERFSYLPAQKVAAHLIGVEVRWVARSVSAGNRPPS